MYFFRFLLFVFCAIVTNNIYISIIGLINAKYIISSDLNFFSFSHNIYPTSSFFKYKIDVAMPGTVVGEVKTSMLDKFNFRYILIVHVESRCKGLLIFLEMKSYSVLVGLNINNVSTHFNLFTRSSVRSSII